MDIKEYIEGEYFVREYPSGTIVKTALAQETNGEVITLPANPLLELQNQVSLIKLAMDDLIMNGGGVL